MSSENDHSHRNPSDPRTLRAVAHPVRIDLIGLLQREGPLTASRCAELLELTPKVCSYHLNLLGRYGLVEETGEGKGRARPWRLVPRPLTYVHEPGEDPDATSAADEFARTMLARDARLVETFIAGRGELPDAWRNVAAMSSSPLRLSPEQLGALGAELYAVLERYHPLSEAPTADAHPVHVALYAVPVEFTDLTKEG